jgi:hypothetical protein
MGLHARVHRVRVCYDLNDRRGVPACVQGHPERFAQAEGRAIQLSDLYMNLIFTDVVLSLGGYTWVVHRRFSRLFEWFEVYVFSVFSFY